jgi:hypothetical protein
MGKNHEGTLKQYILGSEAWYNKEPLKVGREVDDVAFGYYYPNGGTSGEMGMRWYNLGTKWDGNEQVPLIAPRLECYNDAWDALFRFQDVLQAMAEIDNIDITPKQFCQILENCGFVDATPRER